MHWFASDELIQDELRVRMLQNSVPLASGPPQDAMKVFSAFTFVTRFCRPHDLRGARWILDGDVLAIVDIEPRAKKAVCGANREA